MNNIWVASPSSDDPIQVLEKMVINSSYVLQKAAREELVRCQLSSKAYASGPILFLDER